MMFTNICYVAALLGAIFGVLFFAMGIRDAVNIDAPWHSNLLLKLGMELFLGSIALGTIAEISFSVRKK